MNVDISEIRRKTVPVAQYIDSLREPFRQKYLTHEQTCQLKQEAIRDIKKLAKQYTLLVFSAEWCKDCAANVPILALLSEATELEVRVFGGLKKDPLSHKRKWRIPPSPQEVEAFKVEKIPLIIVFDMNGVEIGRIVEKPKQMPTLEEELYQIMKLYQQPHNDSTF